MRKLILIVFLLCVGCRAEVYEIEDARADGYQAGKDGRPNSPYIRDELPRGKQLHAAWEEGYYEGCKIRWARLKETKK